uniref:Uncharacterized protein n=1 Tax=Ditylenchus dipsaci TaxID=166011 RepID=A0A915DAV3_9BILA
MDFSTGESMLVPEGDTLKEAFSAHLVLPDVLNRLPEAKLHISYSDHISIELGNLVMPEYIDLKPMVPMEMFNEKKFYTLIMTDPDVPNRAMPTDREFLHWMVTNITGNSLEKGEEVVEYEAPLPKKGSGLHRYVFVLLEQSRPISFDKTNPDTTLAERKKPSVKSMDSSSISDSEQDLPNRMSNQLNVKGTFSSKTRLSGVLSSRDASPPKYDLSSAHKPILDKNGKAQDPVKHNDWRREGKRAGVSANKFCTKDFMTKYLIRSVAAGNFFQTEFNDYVGEKLTKSLSIDKEKHTEKLTTVMSTTTTATSTTKTVMTTLEKKTERSHNTSSRK